MMTLYPKLILDALGNSALSWNGKEFGGSGDGLPIIFALTACR
mgnify:CR=1 FL=1